VRRADLRTRHLVAAAVSGVLSYASWRLPEPLLGFGIDWVPGLVFGLVVLAPQAPEWWRRAALAAASAVVYRGAVWVAVELAAERSWSEAFAGLAVGAAAAPVLALAAGPLLAGRWRLGANLLAAAAGAAGGALIGLAVATPEVQPVRLHLLLLGGFLLWQVGYAAAHGAASAGWTASR